ncbi:hypothetical protein VCHC50A2_3229B, partial [Vibrio cholerae HC-50A2]
IDTVNVKCEESLITFKLCRAESQKIVAQLKICTACCRLFVWLQIVIYLWFWVCA